MPSSTTDSPTNLTTALPWHHHTADEALAELGSRTTGLHDAEASQRLERWGPNVLPSAPRRGPLLRFFSQFHNVLIYFLLASVVLTWLLDHRVDSLAILAVVIVNAIVGFMQEGRAERALDTLMAMISPEASVIRDGVRRSLPVEALVPGDLVVVEAGDRVPADLRLVTAKALLIEEAALTGESVAAEKHGEPVAEDAPLADRSSMAYSGTLVAAGQATGLVVATGASTEIGHIGTMLGGVQQLVTPLLRQINAFARAITWVALGGGLAVFLIAYGLRDYDWIDALVAVVALAVALVPEGLPAVITITLSIGVQRMAGRHAVVRRLAAVETLGATSVICSDKTGTLTRNEMTVRRLVTPTGTVLFSGAGYAPEGEITDLGGRPAQAPEDLLRSGVLCNEAALRQDGGGWVVDGDPMEGALLVAAIKADLVPDEIRTAHERIDAIPFDADHRYMATLDRDAQGRLAVSVKGAPERVLQMCGSQVDGPLDLDAWTTRIDEAGAEGERVIAAAVVPVPAGTTTINPDDLDGHAVFLGLIGLIDPPRPEAITAIADCHSAGISVAMVTGDHAATASAIARQLRIADDPVVVTGAELDTMDDETFARTATRADVLARTSPEHKLRIVQALQAQGRVVAMTGDGVNDAPALKQADVGVAMGHRGTEAAKESAEMVLLDDDFASIVAAVHEGRVVYDNIRKVVAWTLPTNGGEILTVLTAIVAGFAMPMAPAQILWINLILTITLGLALAFEPAEDGVMSRRPRSPEAPLLSPFLLWRVLLVSVLFLAGALSIFGYAHQRGYDLDLARTLVVNVIVVMEICYLIDIRHLHESSFRKRFMRIPRAVVLAVAVAVVAQIAFTYAPPLQAVFQTQPISPADFGLLFGIGLVLLIVLDVEKRVLRRLGLFHELRA